MTSRHYVAFFATQPVDFDAVDDAKAVRVAERWQRLFWRRYQQGIREMFPGTLTDIAVNSQSVGMLPWVHLYTSDTGPQSEYTLVAQWELPVYGVEPQQGERYAV